MPVRSGQPPLSEGTAPGDVGESLWWAALASFPSPHQGTPAQAPRPGAESDRRGPRPPDRTPPTPSAAAAH